METDLELPDGRTLHVYDVGPEDATVTIYYHHGTPNTGAPPEPLFPAAARLGIRWLSHDRPGYGPSTAQPGRTVASVADDVARVADARGVERFAVLGSSGGGPHALACAALLPDRVRSVATLAGIGPFDADGLDFFAGMASGGVAEIRAATRGADELRRVLTDESDDDDSGVFIAADIAALDGEWAWIGRIAGEAMRGGLTGMVDDDLCVVRPWGFRLADVTAPVLLWHGLDDRMVPCAHGEWLAGRLPTAELRLSPGDGHISVLRHGESALQWIAAR
ncbi:MAG TPA: alpha/beta fold hydrolase [Pseudonocardiaceae bacterium]|jgi:pimeloyl-ACP methyl ester carboxylesterase|nr:alpha/beta fold hydrolase [Pseudonocardiaceae bacterium]